MDTKTCSKCNQMKPCSSFSHTVGGLGRRNTCSNCIAQKVRQTITSNRGKQTSQICMECKHSKDLKHYKTTKAGNLRRICTPCYKAKRAGYKDTFYGNPDNLEHKKAQERAKYYSDPERTQRRREYTINWKSQRPDYRMKSKLKKYGLTLEQYRAILENQGGCCAICRLPPSELLRGKIKQLSVDHNHHTGRVRALLCGPCNSAIGLLKESTELMLAAATYINYHRSLCDNQQEISATPPLLGSDTKQ